MKRTAISVDNSSAATQ